MLVPVPTVPKGSTKIVQALRHVLLVLRDRPVTQVNIFGIVDARRDRIMGVPVLVVTAIHIVPVEP